MARILVVEDEKEIRELICDYMEKEGHIVWAAADGREALDYIMNRPFDLILSDYRIPLLDGLDLIQYLKEAGKTTPVIWVSGEADASAFRLAWKDGLFDFLQKPFSFSQLRDLVDKALTFGNTRVIKSTETK